MVVKAVFFDLGDTIIVEEEQDKSLWEADLKMLPYVNEVLSELKRRNYIIGLITNTVTSREIHVRAALRRLGIEHYFDVVITSVDVGVEKPNEEIFINALRRVDVEPWEAVMVGNRISKDIVGANRVGMISVLIRWRNKYREEALTDLEKPKYEISSLRELIEILNKLEKN
jgi:putative hydrolase of the HAD superfamily